MFLESVGVLVDASASLEEVTSNEEPCEGNDGDCQEEKRRRADAVRLGLGPHFTCTHETDDQTQRKRHQEQGRRRPRSPAVELRGVELDTEEGCSRKPEASPKQRC